MYKVNVLLSTYNGEKFLREQLQSILKQSNVEVSVTIRDDGSTDGTRAILEEASSHSSLNVQFGNNLGWRDSFMNLVLHSPLNENEYYAFADQDDVWKPDKLYKAVSELNRYNVPALYHSNLSMVNSNMEFVSNRYSQSYRPGTQMPQAFFDGVGTGSTMVFNAQMLRLIQQFQPTRSIAHDAYIMALANLLGTVVYDPESQILYRRHEGTATGFGKQKNLTKTTLWMRYKRYKKTAKKSYSIRAKTLVDGYADNMSAEQKKFLTQVAGYRGNFASKLWLLFHANATTLKKTMIIKFRIIMNTL